MPGTGTQKEGQTLTQCGVQNEANSEGPAVAGEGQGRGGDGAPGLSQCGAGRGRLEQRPPTGSGSREVLSGKGAKEASRSATEVGWGMPAGCRCLSSGRLGHHCASFP